MSLSLCVKVAATTLAWLSNSLLLVRQQEYSGRIFFETLDSVRCVDVRLHFQINPTPIQLYNLVHPGASSSIACRYAYYPK